MFLRKTPPRAVPAFIRKHALQRVPWPLLFNAYAFAVLGIPLLILFFPWRMADDLRLNRRGQITERARVDSRAETAMTEDNRGVHRYEFSYTPSDGQPRQARCYESGDTYTSGSPVTVEYLPEKPSIARIQGCRRSAFGWGASFVVFFPAAGCVALGFTLRARRRILRLLTHGQFSSGRIMSVEATYIRLRRQQRFRVSVSFREGDTEHTSHYYAYRGGVKLAENRRNSGETVGVLFDPIHPHRVMIVDELLM